MSKKEKKWRKFYMALMIFIYVVFVPVSVISWLLGSETFPVTAIVVGVSLPFMRQNHINAIRKKEENLGL